MKGLIAIKGNSSRLTYTVKWREPHWIVQYLLQTIMFLNQMFFGWKFQNTFHKLKFNTLNDNVSKKIMLVLDLLHVDQLQHEEQLNVVKKYSVKLIYDFKSWKKPFWCSTRVSVLKCYYSILSKNNWEIKTIHDVTKLDTRCKTGICNVDNNAIKWHVEKKPLLISCRGGLQLLPDGS